MGLKYCPSCGRVVYAKAMPAGYKQVLYKGILAKQRRIAHLEEEGGCGYVWLTYEIPLEYFPELADRNDSGDDHGTNDKT